MKDFVYYNPTRVLFGRGAGKRIVDELAKDGIGRVLLLYGGGSILRNGVHESLTSALAAFGIAHVDCGGVKSNPVLGKVREAAGVVRAEKLEAVLAVGGGSVIDCAKGVAAAALYDGDPWDFYERRAKVDRALPIYAVVTVSATASEMNYTSVITNEELGLKVGLSDERLFPRCTAIDPVVQATVPERQTVDGGIDAISHVLETYFDGVKGVDLQKEYCEGLVRSLIQIIPALRANPGDYEVRAQYAWATVNALNGTTWSGHGIRGDFSSHAIGHTLSAHYDSVHGETLSAIMPAWMRYVWRDDPKTFLRFAERVFGLREGNDEARILSGIEHLREFFASLGAPVTLAQMQIPQGDLLELAKVATRNGPIGVLKKLDTTAVAAILQDAY